MNSSQLSIDQVVAEIERLPGDWPKGGSVGLDWLRAVVRHVGHSPVFHSIETGAGRSTLLLSHLSHDHKVFVLESYGDEAIENSSGVIASPLFNSVTVEFVFGPTQVTLPRYEFKHKLQVALMDGPHGYPFPDLEYYYIYPHLEENALLIVDDIHIPTIRHLFDFLKEDEMFDFLEIVEKTAFFRRTNAPTFDRYLDGWWLQNYNKTRFPIPIAEVKTPTLAQKLKSYIPSAVRKRLKRVLGRSQTPPAGSVAS